MVITVAKKVEFFDWDRIGSPTGPCQSRRVCFGKDVLVDQSVTVTVTVTGTSPSLQDSIISEDQRTCLSWIKTVQLPFTTLFNIDKKSIEINEDWFSKLNRLSSSTGDMAA